MFLKEVKKWDKEADVVILGYGYAGACSAIYAKDAGAKEVIILEKMPQMGGYSIFSGGSVIFGTKYEELLEYYKELCSGRTPDEVIEAQVDGLTKLFGWLGELCKVNNAKLAVSSRGGFNIGGHQEFKKEEIQKLSAACYPIPGGDSLQVAIITEIPGFEGYPWLQSKMAGVNLTKVLEDNINKRNVGIMMSCPAQELITNDSNEVVGVKAFYQGKEICIKARQAVIIATGGFESNENMKLQFFEAKPIYSMGPPCNTGDGIVMAQKVGAALWHMWHYHGSYGFKFPECQVAFRTILRGFRNPNRKLPWILLDKIKGERFMNEYPPAPQDTAHRPLAQFDPCLQRPDFPRIPSWLVFDEKGRKMGPIAHPLTAYKEHYYEWSPDNSKEIEKGWIVKADTIEELAQKIEVDGENLKSVIESWNDSCINGKDIDFGRPPGTMVSIDKAPYYASKVWPLISNTQGGPEHNAKQQILDAFRKPIPGLYAAGECGSMYGHLYQLAGNISECIISGKIAGENAGREKRKE